MNLNQLIHQVRNNCDISDAAFAGHYSVCGLALRLRDLYKWSRRLSPWEEHPAEQVLEWIGNQEDLWDSLNENEYLDLTINGRTYDPFDTTAVNAILNPKGLFYGAGYAHGLKPTFFLADILSKSVIGGKTVWQLGTEQARDLLTLPALAQEGEVVLRTEAARMYLWDQIAYIKNSGRPALQLALLTCCGAKDARPESIRRHLDAIFTIQKDIYIRHEIGELDDTMFDRQIWRRMLTDFPHTTVELLIRALKDVLADTGPAGTLPHLVERRNAAGIGLFIAFWEGLTPLLLAEIKTASRTFFNGRPDWEGLFGTVRQAYQEAADYSREVLQIYTTNAGSKGLTWTREAIEATMRKRKLIE